MTVQCSSKHQKVAVRIQSAWRDDGHATFTQYVDDKNNRMMDMVVSQEHDKVTSLGRAESHVSILLQDVQEGATQAAIMEEGTTTEEESAAETVADDNYSCHVTVQVPEKVNLICELKQTGGSIHVENKIEGDVKLFTNHGSIRAKKLRGHTVDLEVATSSSPSSDTTTNDDDGLIYSSDLLEAEKLRINLPNGGRFRAKRIHGDTVDIKVSSGQQTSTTEQPTTPTPLDDDDEGSLVDVSSMYVSGRGGAHVSLDGGLQPRKRAVRIKSHHGPVLVNVTGVHIPTESMDTSSSGDGDSSGDSGPVYPMVELGSVNGSCEVTVRSIAVGDKEANHDDPDWVACQVHYDSISPESISLLNTERGNIGLTFDRKLEADLRLLSCSDKALLEKTATILVEEDDPEQIKAAIFGSSPEESTSNSPEAAESRISIQTNSFTESRSYSSPDNNMQYTEGWVENKSHEPDSRFEMKTRGDTGLGKIRLDGAANQALKHFSSPQASSSSGEKEEVSVYDTARPLIVAATTGNVSVDTLSWLGAIARRYGLDEKGRSLGRQATRRGRVVLPVDDE